MFSALGMEVILLPQIDVFDLLPSASCSFNIHHADVSGKVKFTAGCHVKAQGKHGVQFHTIPMPSFRRPLSHFSIDLFSESSLEWLPGIPCICLPASAPLRSNLLAHPGRLPQKTNLLLPLLPE